VKNTTFEARRAGCGVYHPSVEHKELWVKLAKKARTPLSKFIIVAVDGVIDEQEDFKPRRELVHEMEALRAENKALRDDLKQKKYFWKYMKVN